MDVDEIAVKMTTEHESKLDMLTVWGLRWRQFEDQMWNKSESVQSTELAEACICCQWTKTTKEEMRKCTKKV